MIRMTAACLVALGLALPAGAWTLEPDTSSISYVTIKNGDTAEANMLTQLGGGVADDGRAEVEISLSSVETFIDIRNERMREILFRVADFPVATVSAALNMDDLGDLAPGGSMLTTFEITLAANGEEASYDASALITRASEDRVIVSSMAPIIVYTDELGYDDGVERLREIAGLDSIEPAVPVSFNLAFAR